MKNLILYLLQEIFVDHLHEEFTIKTILKTLIFCVRPLKQEPVYLHCIDMARKKISFTIMKPLSLSSKLWHDP